MSPTTESEILGIILSLKDNKSTGFDNFSDELVKNITREIAHVIAYINVSFESGIFPEEQSNCEKGDGQKACKYFNSL